MHIMCLLSTEVVVVLVERHSHACSQAVDSHFGFVLKERTASGPRPMQTEACIGALRQCADPGMHRDKCLSTTNIVICRQS
ncbi:MAG: hypothetical protein CMH65_02315 [Nevskiales bacterium]|nr:hypothetical protein [Nevskiales bacterium]